MEQKICKIIERVTSEGKRLKVFYEPTQGPQVRDSSARSEAQSVDPSPGLRVVRGDAYSDFDEAGRRHGLYRRRNSAGNLIEECTFKHGVLQGQYTCWYDDGRMSRQSNYENGVLFGLSKTWYPSGLPASEELWDGGWFPRERVEYYERYSGNGAFSAGGVKSLVWTIGEHTRRTLAWGMNGELYTDRTEEIPEEEAWNKEKYGPLLWLQEHGSLKNAKELLEQSSPGDLDKVVISVHSEDKR